MKNTTKITQYIHRPNNTELGKGNTHETYMLIPSNIDVSSIFPSSVEVVVTDSISGKKYRLKSAYTKEFRVNQMGDIYRDYKVEQGDEVVFTFIQTQHQQFRFVTINKYNRIVISSSKKGSEISNLDRIESFKQSNNSYRIKIYNAGTYSDLVISFLSSQKKRQDSPTLTDFYNVQLAGNSIVDGTHYVTLGERNTFATLEKYTYTEYEFENLELLKSILTESTKNVANQEPLTTSINPTYRPYITAIRTKPFILLAGISGTGKSRIVRELARACSGDYDSQKPQNFEMIQVKPNWHDSSDILGYVSRVSGTPVFVAGDFLKFVVKAWEYPEMPYFLCLDEMNLAPVEQYFAEFLSVFESRKLNDEGEITTDPILKKEAQEWYHTLVCSLTENDTLQQQLLQNGISLPQNLIIVGTVNMDETTFSFSSKVLDRAMTIEMNTVDLRSGLDNKHESIGKISKNEIIADSVEGVDIYQNNKEVCDQVLDFLQKVNDVLEGSPFKIAYRTRNEFLIYVVNNLPYKKDKDGVELSDNQNIERSLDEVTCMKILPRIEGDEEKTSKVLAELEIILKEQLADFLGDGFDENKSISLKKIKEMKKRLKSGYTSFWS